MTWALAYLFFDPPSTVLMMQRAAEGETIRHYPVPLNRMSPHIVRAVIAAEDANFCTHDGFDIEAIQDALESNRRGRTLRGGSTISQQTAKNLFLWPDRGWVRKGFETYQSARRPAGRRSRSSFDRTRCTASTTLEGRYTGRWGALPGRSRATT